MGGFSLWEMMVNGWPVLSVLLVMSIASCTAIMDRLLALRRTRENPGAFVSALIRLLDERGIAPALDHCRRHTSPIAIVAQEVLKRAGDRSAMEQAAAHALQAQVDDLDQYVPLMGTVASTAPFVGLLGTVIGIIRAFRDISVNVGGGPEVVSAGIAEALITTAFGLLVAIPAVMGFNYFVRRIQRIGSGVDLAVFTLIEHVGKQETSRA